MYKVPWCDVGRKMSTVGSHLSEMCSACPSRGGWLVRDDRFLQSMILARGFVRPLLLFFSEPDTFPREGRNSNALSLSVVLIANVIGTRKELKSVPKWSRRPARPTTAFCVLRGRPPSRSRMLCCQKNAQTSFVLRAGRMPNPFNFS